MVLILTDLVGDVLLKIAYECSPCDVLALEKTCTSLRDLFSTPLRSLWLHLLRSLDDFHAPSLPPNAHIPSLSSLDLKRIVSHAVQGNANWCSSSSSESGPRITRRRTINLRNIGGILGFIGKHSPDTREAIKLLPGGKHACVLWSEGYLQCWDIARSTCIWTYPQLGGFLEMKVISYDVEYDVKSGQLLFVVVGRYLEPINDNEPCFIGLFLLNPDSKRVTRLRGRSMGWIFPTSLRICGDAIVMSGSHCVITNRKLDRCFALRDTELLYLTLSTSNGYLLFIGYETPSTEFTLFALDAQRIFTSPSKIQIPLASGGPLGPRDALSIKSDLTNFILKAMIVVPDERDERSDRKECLLDVQLTACAPTWRSDSNLETGKTSNINIYVIGKLGNKQPHSQSQSTHERFFLSSFSLSSSNHSSAYSLPPSLTHLRTTPAISVPLTHPFCASSLHALSNSGRGLVASVNTLHKGIRYLAFSVGALFLAADSSKKTGVPISAADQGHGRGSMKDGNTVRQIASGQRGGEMVEEREAFFGGPISFGRDRVAPSEVWMERYSGAVAFVSKDERELVIQYYD